MHPIMIYNMISLRAITFKMQMITRFFPIITIFKVSTTTTSFIPTITLSMMKPNVVIWDKSSIYYMFPNRFTMRKLGILALTT